MCANKAVAQSKIDILISKISDLNSGLVEFNRLAKGALETEYREPEVKSPTS